MQESQKTAVEVNYTGRTLVFWDALRTVSIIDILWGLLPCRTDVLENISPPSSGILGDDSIPQLY
jgi:hypothetical protein